MSEEKKKPSGCFLAIVFLGLSALGFGTCHAVLDEASKPKQKLTQKPASKVVSRHVTNKGHLASLTREDLDRAVRMSISKDYEALSQMLDNQSIIELKAGMEVEIVDSYGFLGEVLKIRPRGTLIEVFTLREAVTREDITP